MVTNGICESETKLRLMGWSWRSLGVFCNTSRQDLTGFHLIVRVGSTGCSVITPDRLQVLYFNRVHRGMDYLLECIDLG